MATLIQEGAPMGRSRGGAPAGAQGIQPDQNIAGKIAGGAEGIGKFFYPEGFDLLTGEKAGARSLINQLQALRSGDSAGFQRLSEDFDANINRTGMEAAGEAVGAGVLDLLTAGIGGKIVGPAMKNIGLPSLRTPAALRSALGKAQSQVGQELDELLTAATIAGKRIPANEVLQKLGTLRSQVIEESAEFAPKAIDKVDEIIATVQKAAGDLGEIAPKKAAAIKRGLDKDIYGEAGKDLKRRGAVGIAKMKALKKTANQLRGDLREQIPGASELLDKYGALARTAGDLQDPFKGFYKGSIPGALLSPLAVANPSLGFPLIAGTAGGVTAAAMPYTRNLLRKLLGESVRPAAQVIRGGAQNLLRTE